MKLLGGQGKDHCPSMAENDVALFHEVRFGILDDIEKKSQAKPAIY